MYNYVIVKKHTFKNKQILLDSDNLRHINNHDNICLFYNLLIYIDIL